MSTKERERSTARQTTADAGAVSNAEREFEQRLCGLSLILWQVGQRHPDADLDTQARMAAERGRDAGILDGGDDA